MAYYGTGSKVTIMTAVEAAVKSAGMVYTDMQRSYNTSITPDKFPGAFINDIREDKEQVLKDLVRNTLAIGVVGWVRVATGANLWTALNAMVEAVKTKLRADPQLGSQCYDLVLTRVETDAGSRYPVGVFVLVLNCIYYSER